MDYNKGSDGKLMHATFDLPAPTVHPSHPFRNKGNHDKLLDYLRQRLMFDKPNRDQRILKFAKIDRDVAAWVKLSTEDKKRKDKHERDGSPQATQVSLPLTWVHLDDMMTYYAQTFAPNRGMFYHTAGPDSTNEAEQLVAIMNNHAVYGSYYRQLLRAIFNLLKYNVGGLSNVWESDYGPKLSADAQGNPTITSQTVFSGNKVKAVDMYNLFYDPAVEPNMLYKDGEWVATAEVKSHYWLKNKCLEGQYYMCEDLLDCMDGGSILSALWYRDPPVESRLTVDDSSAAPTNWFAFMAGGDSTIMNNAYELVTMYIKINPNDFGLIPGSAANRKAHNRYEVWRFTICNDECIIEAKSMDNMHGYLPNFFGVINDDFMRDASKSPAEILNPLQEFSSFLLNAHVLANRKNIFGTTYYDPSRLDYEKIPEGEVAAKVPIKAQGYGQDIRTMVYKESNQLDTKQTMNDMQGMIALIDQFFPTQSLPSQIAGIDRAIDSQVAAVQQGTNRRQHKGARLIDDTLMRPLRYALYYNIVQYIQDSTVIADYFTGKETKVDLTKLQSTSLVHLIGQGLKAIDRQSVVQQMQSVIFALIQAPQASQRVDILAMIEYWLSMMDMEANMKQFEIAAPPPPEAGGTQPGAVDATGKPVVPATNPDIMTAPIYGR